MLLLLTRKAITHFKHSLMGYSNRIIEHSSAESHGYYNGPAQEVSEKNASKWPKDHSCDI